MRRFGSVFVRRKTAKDEVEDQPKRSWKTWLKKTTTSSEESVSSESHTVALVLPPPMVSPFVEDGQIFPRSVNNPQLNHRQYSLRVHLLKSTLVRTKFQEPSGSDFPNISRPNPMTSCPGIRRWLSRPCFEARNVVYLPSQTIPVSASLAVAALEFSEHLHVMADPDPAPRNTQLPSPLRNQHPLPPLATSHITDPTPMTSTSPMAAVKRVVRFAEQDGDSDDDNGEDAVPLHLIRQKRLREQKIRFLQQERLRRVREEELQRKQLEKEAVQRERKRALLETERAKVEKECKEKDQAILVDEVAKARMRRELQRAGGVPALIMRDRENLGAPAERNKTHLSSSSSAASLRSVQAANLRKDSFDPSHHHHHLQPHHHHPSASDSSPSSSRPSSIHVPTNNSPLHQSHSNSRPPSTYSSSSESGGKRSSSMHMSFGSMMPMPNIPMNMSMPMQAPTYLPSPIIVTYPPFASSNPNLSYVPPIVPSFPDYMTANDHDMMQMPLLPPTAPFMKQPSYERRRSSASVSGSERNLSPVSVPSSNGSRRGSFSSSSERERTGSSLTKSRSGRPSTLGEVIATPKKASQPILGRVSSHTSNQSRSHSHRSSSGPAKSSSESTSRGRLGQPIRHSTMQPVSSPWTGVPTAQQRAAQTQIPPQDGANGSVSKSTGGSTRLSLSFGGSKSPSAGASSSTSKKRGGGGGTVFGVIGKSIAKNKTTSSSLAGWGQTVGMS